MTTRSNVQINLSIPENYRNLLRKMAAERVLKNPGQIVTGASIATEMLMAALEKSEEKNNIEGEN